MRRLAVMFALAPVAALAACSNADLEAEAETLRAAKAALETQLGEAQAAIATAEEGLEALRAELEAVGPMPDTAPDLFLGLPEPAASAAILDGGGEQLGEALFWPAQGGVLMRIYAVRLQPGVNGLHFHQVGTCDGEDGFTTAGGHVGHETGPHGFLNTIGAPHPGDLPNLLVHASNAGLAEIYTTLVTLDDGPNGLLDADGASILIHADPDDHATQPIGNAGRRIACGVIQRAE